nr:hypothetical protein GCM10020093_071880 [Planobispora longispora]
MALRVLDTPDGGRWLFGAHARWYRQDPADGRWHLSPPPADRETRAAARIVRIASVILPHLVPAGPDFAVDRGSVQGFVGPDVPHGVTERVRTLVVAQRGRRREDFPMHGPFTELFAGEVASPVAAVWGTLMWCAYAPAFDGNEVLLSMFGEFLSRPLPGDEWVRWLAPVSLDDLIALYGERVRAGHPEAGLRLVALMADTAQAVRGDRRFRPRAEALLAMVAPILRRTGEDVSAAHRGDDALRQAWLARCPAHVALAEVSPGTASSTLSTTSSRPWASSRRRARTRGRWRGAARRRRRGARAPGGRPDLPVAGSGAPPHPPRRAHPVHAPAAGLLAAFPRRRVPSGVFRGVLRAARRAALRPPAAGPGLGGGFAGRRLRHGAGMVPADRDGRTGAGIRDGLGARAAPGS